ncbi:LysR family transcriptional regulator [Roseobacter sp. YSTF-M11]|uniref:LysR family transcriptional regulator n=1 Tax=Roseobacter insulae TaxID=2859783 RepID=A0A9X1FUZ3_9RHOB|nr:LysR family transcriptional regulator [Roseobacter insulae]MBW4708216.1 LysR family transcriptional regulator [Roseobacter insulae]
MDKIETMRAFAAVAQDKSFTAAAKRLGVSTKLVSKYVAQLENRLAVQLFNRTTRSVALTDSGQAYLERCKSLLEQFDELDALVQDRQTALSGPIRLTAPTGFGSTKLIPPLRDFMQTHPGVTLDLRLTDTRVALVEEGLDLAIRIGALPDSTLVARKLSDMPLVICASPDYLATHGTPDHPAALSTHSCLINDGRLAPETWPFFKNGRSHAIHVSGGFHANAPAAIAEMAMGGLGVAMSPMYAVETALATGQLLRLFADYKTEDMGLYALYPPNRHLTSRVRALIDHLVGSYAGRW